MLFDTVDGLDLEPFYRYLLQVGPTSEAELMRVFIPSFEDGNASDTNFTKVRNFLCSAGCIEKREDGMWEARTFTLPFRLALLERLQGIRLGSIPSDHELDPVYLDVIDKVFVQPQRHYVAHLHTEIAESGIPNINDTKVVTWRKVMQALGLGQFDKQGGFYFSVTEDLFCEILQTRREERSDLQAFLEEHFSRFLPYATSDGDLSRVVYVTMESLQKRGILSLSIKQDSPTRTYTEQRWREISVNKERLANV